MRGVLGVEKSFQIESAVLVAPLDRYFSESLLQVFNVRSDLGAFPPSFYS